MMSKDNDYKKISAYYLFGTLFSKGLAFFTVPIFTRIMSTNDYGIVNTYNSWVAILSMIIGLTLHMGIRAAFIDYEEKIDEFMSSMISVTLIITFFVFISGCFFSLILNKEIDFKLILFCIFQSSAGALISDYSMYLMMQYKYKFRTLLMILPDLLGAILSTLIIVFVLNDKLYYGRIIPNSFVYIISGILVIILVYKKAKPSINKKYIKYGIAISAPLILHGISLTILSQSDRTMITLLADASQTGIYSLLYNFGMLATVITTSFDGVWVPWFTQKMIAKDYKNINNISKYYLEIMTCAMNILILVGPEIVKILASSAYWEGIKIIPPIVLANYMIFLYSLYVNIEHFFKKTVIISINTLVAALLNIVLNYIFIPQYGYVAAAYTTLVSYIFVFVLHKNYANKLLKDLFAFKMFIPSIIELIITITVFYTLSNNVVIRWGIGLLYCIFKLYKYKEQIIDFLNIKIINK